MVTQGKQRRTGKVFAFTVGVAPEEGTNKLIEAARVAEENAGRLLFHWLVRSGEAATVRGETKVEPYKVVAIIEVLEVHEECT